MGLSIYVVTFMEKVGWRKLKGTISELMTGWKKGRYIMNDRMKMGTGKGWGSVVHLEKSIKDYHRSV